MGAEDGDVGRGEGVAGVASLGVVVFVGAGFEAEGEGEGGEGGVDAGGLGGMLDGLVDGLFGVVV